MKQVEKKDIILRFLYENRDNNQEYSIKEILNTSSIETNDIEVARIADDLSSGNLIHLNNLSSTLKKAKISSKGVEYCEEDSFSDSGRSIVNNYQIKGGKGANIIIDSPRSKIKQTFNSDAQSSIENIKKELEKEQFELEFKKEVLDCLNEIEEALKNGNTPKFAMQSLLSMLSESSSIGAFAISLAQTIGVSTS